MEDSIRMVKTEVKKISSSKRELTITMEKDALEPIREKQAKRVQKEVQYPGFRKGKAPLNLIKRRYADAIEAYTLDMAMDQGLRQAAEENELVVLGTPEAKKIDFDENGNLVSVIEVETYPEIELKQYKGFEFTRDKYVITDKIVEETIERLLHERAEIHPVDGPVAEGHTAILDMQELDENEKPIKDKKYENISVHIGDGKFDPDLEKQIIGMKVDEEKIITKKYPDDFPQEEFAGKEEKYLIKVKNIEEEVLPELTDDLVKELDLDVVTVEELRQLTRDNLEKNYQREAENRLVTDVYQKLIEENPFDLPQALIDNYLNHMVQDVKAKNPQLPEAEIRNYYQADAIYQMKVYYLRDAIAKAENIEVTEEDIQKFLEEIKDEKVRDLYKQNEQLLNSVKEDILGKKVFDFILENSKINDNEITLE